MAKKKATKKATATEQPGIKSGKTTKSGKKVAKKPKQKKVEFRDGNAIIPQSEYDKIRAELDALHAINEKNREVSRLREKHDEAAERKAVAKKALDTSMEELNELIAEAESPQLKLPGMSRRELQQQQAATADRSVDLDKVPIAELGLASGHADKLAGVGVSSIGDLERLRAGKDPDRPRGLAQVKGLGEVAITKIEDAVLKWLEANSGPPGDAPAQTISAGQLVTLARNVKGFANKKDGLYEGQEFEVSEVNGDSVRVVSKSGRPVTLNPDDFRVAV